MSIMNLFNGGGSVGSRSSAGRPGPKTKQKLHPRHDPGYNPVPLPKYGTDPRHKPVPLPKYEYGTDPRHKPTPMPGYGIDPRYKPVPMPRYGSTLAGIDQSDLMGIMAFNDPDVNQMKDDYFGHRFLDTAWGRATLGQWAKKFGLGPESAQNLEDAIGGGGFSAFGGTISPDVGIGDDSWSLGFTRKWNTPKWLGG